MMNVWLVRSQAGQMSRVNHITQNVQSYSLRVKGIAGHWVVFPVAVLAADMGVEAQQDFVTVQKYSRMVLQWKTKKQPTDDKSNLFEKNVLFSCQTDSLIYEGEFF